MSTDLIAAWAPLPVTMGTTPEGLPEAVPLREQLLARAVETDVLEALLEQVLSEQAQHIDWVTIGESLDMTEMESPQDVSDFIDAVNERFPGGVGLEGARPEAIIALMRPVAIDMIDTIFTPFSESDRITALAQTGRDWATPVDIVEVTLRDPRSGALVTGLYTGGMSNGDSPTESFDALAMLAGTPFSDQVFTPSR